jgi:hypothetical protein
MADWDLFNPMDYNNCLSGCYSSSCAQKCRANFATTPSFANYAQLFGCGNIAADSTWIQRSIISTERPRVATLHVAGRINNAFGALCRV